MGCAGCAEVGGFDSCCGVAGVEFFDVGGVVWGGGEEEDGWVEFSEAEDLEGWVCAEVTVLRLRGEVGVEGYGVAEGGGEG